MTAVAVEITRFVDRHQPGWVECRLVDAHGRAWTFHEKAPVVTDEDLDEHSAYPRPGALGCQIVATRRDDAGRDLVTIDFALPHDLEALEGGAQFEVLASQLVR